MKAAGEVANQVLMRSGETHRPHSEPAKDRLAQKFIDRLFMRLQAIYRQKWSSQFSASGGKAGNGGDAAYRAISAEWAKTLGDLGSDQIAAGLERMKDSPRFDEWPPSPVQFRRLCKPRREPYERVEFQGNALPAAATADRASALTHIEQIKQRLAKGSHARVSARRK